MQVSTKLFNKQSVENFSDLTAQIQKKQEQVATGKHLTEPSDDPVKAGRVMVVKEQKAQTEQYLRNIDLSYVKLGLTDGALDEVQNLLTRAYELSVQAATATNANARGTIATEMRAAGRSSVGSRWAILLLLSKLTVQPAMVGTAVFTPSRFRRR